MQFESNDLRQQFLHLLRFFHPQATLMTGLPASQVKWVAIGTVTTAPFTGALIANTETVRAENVATHKAILINRVRDMGKSSYQKRVSGILRPETLFCAIGSSCPTHPDKG